MSFTPETDLKKYFLKHRVCKHCKAKFTPHVRLNERQKSCGKKECQVKHRTKYQRQYRKRNRETELEYQKKRKENQASNYWMDFRLRHPDYVVRNRAQAKLRKLLKKTGLQRKLDISEVAENTGAFLRFSEFATRHRSLVKDAIGIDAA